ncbi:MAG: hypothetical protein NC453_07410 [Muribaculum sp.]|nr:hypothetical protein [Muribaculum sp.]
MPTATTPTSQSSDMTEMFNNPKSSVSMENSIFPANQPMAEQSEPCSIQIDSSYCQAAQERPRRLPQGLLFAD